MSISTEIEEEWDDFNEAKRQMNAFEKMKDRGYLTEEGYRNLAGSLFNRMTTNSFASSDYSWAERKNDFYGDW